jgi:2-polyprenyl-6-methoxyphenol hydroxylase-like FAD-dependent oxidoreductase
MSPIGGVGINLAIQDAVAAANILAPVFTNAKSSNDGYRPINETPLAAVQRRREWPTKMTQRLQTFLQNRVIERVLAQSGPMQPAWPVRVIAAVPLLRAIPAYVVGIGFRPEHIRTPDVYGPSTTRTK